MSTVTSIVLVSALGVAIEPDQVLPDEELQDLGARLATHGQKATVERDPPPIWTWEPLVESGLVSLDGLVAVAELDMPDSDVGRNALRMDIADWLAGSSARGKVRVSIVWATQMITFTIETLPYGVAESKERYGRQDQGTTAVSQRPQGA
jgi:hypothetical protein